MKKIGMALIWAVALSAFKAQACDICGCGVGTNYIGILPEFRKIIFGFRYRYNTLLTHLGNGGASTYLTTRETYQIAEAWGGWTIGTKIRLMGTIPFTMNQKLNQGDRISKSGIGDFSIAGYYQLLNNRKTIKGSRLLVQSLWMGAGIKWATGKYDPADKTPGANNSNLFQLGTGSTDMNLSAMYHIRLQDAGINLNSNYKINSANQYGYHYGNKFNMAATVYYKLLTRQQFSIAPNAGIQFESSVRDDDKGFSVFASGGHVALGTIGVEMLWRRMAFGANAQAPVTQNLAEGMVRAGNRFMLHVAYTL